MKTTRVFVYSLLLSFAILFAIYDLIGYAASAGYPSALGRAFRDGLEVSLTLSILNWIINRINDLRRRLHSAIGQVSSKLPK